MIEFKEHDTKVLKKYPEETLKCNYLIPFYVGHLDNFYIDLENLDPTGPSGGAPHFWRCLNCGDISELLDK